MHLSINTVEIERGLDNLVETLSSTNQINRSAMALQPLSVNTRWHCELWGWIAFTVSAVLYGIASARIQDWLNFSASMAFLAADLLFLVPFLLSPETLLDPTAATMSFQNPQETIPNGAAGKDETAQDKEHGNSTTELVETIHDA